MAEATAAGQGAGGLGGRLPPATEPVTKANLPVHAAFVKCVIMRNEVFSCVLESFDRMTNADTPTCVSDAGFQL